MGVYGTSAPLDSRDIDYDDDDDEVQYIECSQCGDEYCEDELTVMTEDGLYQENVCEDCIDRYKQVRQEYIDEAISAVEERWGEGSISKDQY